MGIRRSSEMVPHLRGVEELCGGRDREHQRELQHQSRETQLVKLMRGFLARVSLGHIFRERLLSGMTLDGSFIDLLL